jgi:hypothetical protein
MAEEGWVVVNPAGGIVELTAKEAGKAESMATGEEWTVD